MSFDWTPHLEEGEEVLWTGMQDLRIVPLWRRVFMILVVFFVVLFCIPITAGKFGLTLSLSREGFHVLLGLVAALALLSGYLAIKNARRAPHLHYAITTRNAIVCSETKPDRPTKFPLRDKKILMYRYGFTIVAKGYWRRRGYFFWGLTRAEVKAAERQAMRVSRGYIS